MNGYYIPFNFVPKIAIKEAYDRGYNDYLNDNYENPYEDLMERLNWRTGQNAAESDCKAVFIPKEY